MHLPKVPKGWAIEVKHIGGTQQWNWKLKKRSPKGYHSLPGLSTWGCSIEELLELTKLPFVTAQELEKSNSWFPEKEYEKATKHNLDILERSKKDPTYTVICSKISPILEESFK